MRNWLIKIWPFLLIGLATLIFFYPVFLKGEIPLPGDFTVGVYYPWLDYKWPGYPTGVPVKNPITADVVSFIYPMQIFAVDLLKSGSWPLWNPLILTGTPLLANFQSAPFSPTNFLYWLLPRFSAWSLQIMMQPFLAAVFLYLLLRNFGISKISSVVGGLFYGFAGFLMIWMEWNGHSLVAAFFPLIMLLIKKWIETQKFIWGALLSLSLAMQIFSGYPQIILYEFLAIILLVYFFEKSLFRNYGKLLKLSLFLVLGIGLAGLQILPGLELLRFSQRSVENVLNTGAFLPPQYLITFLAPDFFGNHATGNFWGVGDYTLVTGFSGVVVVILAGMGFLANKKIKQAKFAFSLFVLSLIIALPNPLTTFLKESGLFGLQAASAHRALVLSNLGLAILAAFGLDSFFLLNKKNLFKAFLIPGILLFIFTVVSILEIFWFKNTNFNVGLKNLILPVAIFSFTILLVLSTRYFKNRNLVMGLLIIMGLFELFRFGWKFTPFSPKEFVFPKTPILDFLISQKKPFRVAAEDTIPINMMMPYQIETVEGYDAVYPLRFADYLAALNSGQVGNSPQGRYGSVTNVDNKLFDLANGKFVLILKRDQNGKPDQKGDIPKKFSNQKFKKVFEDKTVVILENTLVLPRSFFVSNWITEVDNQRTLNGLMANDFPIDKKIILEEEFNSFEKSKDNDATVAITGKDFKVETTKPGFLFISQIFYPGWKASVDGIETKIYLADYSFQAIPLRAGNHQIKVWYDPDSFKLGAVISLLSVLVLGMIGIGSRYESRI